jgi:hypothetical protein
MKAGSLWELDWVKLKLNLWFGCAGLIMYCIWELRDTTTMIVVLQKCEIAGAIDGSHGVWWNDNGRG